MHTEFMKNEIRRLKKEKNAIILAHYYQDDDVQDIADAIGDSFALSVLAKETDAEIIVFCGVHFMAETAKILAPNKKVLLPVKEAGCPMADMITKQALQQYKEKNPDTIIICYVNSTAEVKAISDVCVTSSNALKIIKHYSQEKIMYAPDQNLGTYVNQLYGTKMEVWPGYCCIHNDLTTEMITQKREVFPNAQVLVHPEAKFEVLQMADFVGSTKQMVEFAKTSPSLEFIVGTEKGILYQMKKDNPNKQFHLLSEGLACYDMKLTKIDDVYQALYKEQYEVTVNEEIREKANQALQKMLDLS